MTSLGALTGIAAPASFITAWVVGGARTPGYSPVRDHISDLAAVGAPTRTLMTSGLLAFSALAPVFARHLSRSLDQPALRISLTTAAVATLGVAAFPLEGPLGTGPHATAAAVSYLAMSSNPLLGAAALRRSGNRRLAALSLATGVVGGAFLVRSLVGDQQGLFQRLGITSLDGWLIGMAVRDLRRQA